MGGDLAEFGKKRNTDYDLSPPLYVGGKFEKKNNAVIFVIVGFF